MAPQADTIPTSFSIRHKFEELPLFWQFTGNVPWRGIQADGEFEVTVEPNGDWTITDIWLSVDNGRFGKEAAGCLVNLNADINERLYLTILDALDMQYGFRIQEWIADELDERNLKVAA